MKTKIKIVGVYCQETKRAYKTIEQKGRQYRNTEIKKSLIKNFLYYLKNLMLNFKTMTQGTTFKEFKQLLITNERLKNIYKAMQETPTKEDQ
jgi:hypothetical protein